MIVFLSSGLFAFNCLIFKELYSPPSCDSFYILPRLQAFVNTFFLLFSEIPIGDGRRLTTLLYYHFPHLSVNSFFRLFHTFRTFRFFAENIYQKTDILFLLKKVLRFQLFYGNLLR